MALNNSSADNNVFYDAYDAILEIAKLGYHLRFQASRNGVISTYTIAEHFNMGRGWLLRDTQTHKIVPSSSLRDVVIPDLPSVENPNAVEISKLKERTGTNMEFVFDLENLKPISFKKA